MREVREAGARIRLITDGDVSAALLAVSDRSPVDLLWGIGGTPEGVLSAAALKSMGGQLLGRLWPRDDGERQAAIDAGYDLDRILTADDLCSGDDVFFSATGVTDGDVLQGVRYRGTGATTESLVMRSRSGTVRRVHARHDRSKLRAIIGETLRLIRSQLEYRRGCDRGRRFDRLRRRQALRAPAWRGARGAGAGPPSGGRPTSWSGWVARSAKRTCSSRTRSARRWRASTSPTTWSTRWGGAATATSPRAIAGWRRELRRRGRCRGGASGSSTWAGWGRAPNTWPAVTPPPKPCGPDEVPVTYFRAAAVIGAGSESFLTVFYLVRRLPLMVTPTLGHHPHPADRDRRRGRLPRRRRRPRCCRSTARSRSAAPTSPPTAG